MNYSPQRLTMYKNNLRFGYDFMVTKQVPPSRFTYPTKVFSSSSTIDASLDYVEGLESRWYVAQIIDFDIPMDATTNLRSPAAKEIRNEARSASYMPFKKERIAIRCNKLKIPKPRMSFIDEKFGLPNIEAGATNDIGIQLHTVLTGIGDDGKWTHDMSDLMSNNKPYIKLGSNYADDEYILTTNLDLTNSGDYATYPDGKIVGRVTANDPVDYFTLSSLTQGAYYAHPGGIFKRRYRLVIFYSYFMRVDRHFEYENPNDANSRTYLRRVEFEPRVPIEADFSLVIY